MQTGTTIEVGAVGAGRRQLGEYDRKGFTIITFMSGDAYLVVVRHDSRGEVQEFAGENRGRIERKAEEWVDREAEQAEQLARELAAPEDDDPAIANGGEPLIVGGWLLRLGDDTGGTFRVEFVDACTGKTPRHAPEFRKYLKSDQAVAEAQEWAAANPLRTRGEFNGLACEIERRREDAWAFSVLYPLGTAGQTGKFDSLVHPSPEHVTKAAQIWCGAFRIGGELPVDRPIADAELVEQLPEPVPIASAAASPPEPPTVADSTPAAASPAPAAAEPVAAAQAAAQAAAPAAPAAAATPVAMSARAVSDRAVSEVLTKLGVRNGLASELALLRVRKKRLAAEEKELVAKIEEMDTEIRLAFEQGPGQAWLPLIPAPEQAAPEQTVMPQAAVAKAAEQTVHELEGPEVACSFNGVDHVIRVDEFEPGKWRAYLKGHEGRTEAFDPDRAAAISQCKDRAAIVFADAEPGATAIPDPSKKTRGRKKAAEEQPPPAEESADAKHVIETLRLSMDIEEAAKKLKRSAKTLQKWAAENGVIISEHLGRDVGKDEPAPTPKKRSGGGSKAGSGKARGKRGR